MRRNPSVVVVVVMVVVVVVVPVDKPADTEGIRERKGRLCASRCAVNHCVECVQQIRSVGRSMAV